MPPRFGPPPGFPPSFDKSQPPPGMPANNRSQSQWRPRPAYSSQNRFASPQNSWNSNWKANWNNPGFRQNFNSQVSTRHVGLVQWSVISCSILIQQSPGILKDHKNLIKIYHFVLTLLSNFKYNLEISSNFIGLLRIYELYLVDLRRGSWVQTTAETRCLMCGKGNSFL